jgi:OOP family OmpA-OmpF porin
MGPEDRMISIYFGGGSYYIDYDQHVELIDFINDIEDLVGYQIEVHGHTDNIGSMAYNRHLSHLRCEAVKDILRELLIDEETIFQYDHGEENPNFSNETLQGKLHNRRVDVIIRRLAV